MADIASPMMGRIGGYGMLAVIGMQLSAAPAIADPHRLPAALPVSAVVQAAPPLASPSALLGREDDARVARIGFALATAGLGRCPLPDTDAGVVLQHLSQFESADRPAMIAAQSLDRGPGVIVVIAGGPAEAAGLRPGDVLLAIDGRPLPPDDPAASFDQVRARAHADRIADLLTQGGTTPVAITFGRDGIVSTVRLAPRLACASRVHLARSAQRNAFADGRHVFLTTGLLARVAHDDELAFIIAHEMAHNILHHAAILRGGTVRGIGRMLGRSGRIVRGTEREADLLGGELMIDAGFDPVVGAGVLGRLGTELGSMVFASHDSTDRRIAAMRMLVDARRNR